MIGNDGLLLLTHYRQSDCFDLLCEALSGVVNNGFCVLCIGCNCVLYDCLGPLCGTYINELSGIPVYGTLKKPVDANNLSFTLDRLNYFYPELPIVTVDSLKSDDTELGTLVFSRGAIPYSKGALAGWGYTNGFSIGAITKSSKNSLYKRANLYEIDYMASLIARAVQFSVCKINY